MTKHTNAYLTEQLNKVTADRDLNAKRLETTQRYSCDLQVQLAWQKQLNLQLVETLLAGAKEGTWPRRPNQ